MTAESSREDVVSRGDQMLDLVRQRSVIDTAIFNDMTDFDIDVVPGVMWDDLNTFNAEHQDGKMKIEKVDNKHIIITLPEEEGVSQELVVKVKFFNLPDAEETGSTKTRVKFIRKRGDLDKWYSMFKDMKDAVLEDILIAPIQPILVE
jgi:hypothetical protein